jgi:hypothetical protein
MARVHRCLSNGCADARRKNGLSPQVREQRPGQVPHMTAMEFMVRLRALTAPLRLPSPSKKLSPSRPRSVPREGDALVAMVLDSWDGCGAVGGGPLGRGARRRASTLRDRLSLRPHLGVMPARRSDRYAAPARLRQPTFRWRERRARDSGRICYPPGACAVQTTRSVRRRS